MNAIELEDVRKTFTLRVGRGWWNREHRTINAVDGICFTVPAGQSLAFIGPNGAGKSTTIKMLTGILHPSSGQARVLGFTPWLERNQLAYRIGAVFGQRSQVWYHLPRHECVWSTTQPSGWKGAESTRYASGSQPSVSSRDHTSTRRRVSLVAPGAFFGHPTFVAGLGLTLETLAVFTLEAFVLEAFDLASQGFADEIAAAQTERVDQRVHLLKQGFIHGHLHGFHVGILPHDFVGCEASNVKLRSTRSF
jgi:hypothetical protein